jgi:hypothetical protein
MNVKYKFDSNAQTAYGIVRFLSALIIVFVATNEFNWGLALGIGPGNFIVSGNASEAPVLIIYFGPSACISFDLFFMPLPNAV